jgi:DNA-3-methyladenine glycosylase
MLGTPLSPSFFDRDAQVVACDLIGKALCHLLDGIWLGAAIVETEAYYRAEKASHASLGYTEKRKALFMPPGTIYMYYARGGDSFNVSCAGAGNAVLVKSGMPACVSGSPEAMIAAMARRNALPSGRPRAPARLCAGQTLLCRALGLQVPEWDGVPIGEGSLRLLEVGYRPRRLVRAQRLGIPAGRDGHLPYRFIDGDRLAHCTRNPIRRGGPPGSGTTLLAVPPGQGAPDWASLLADTAGPAFRE